MSRRHFKAEDLNLLESGLYSDATITCGDRTWNVHKSIILRCEWFKKAFGGDFKEAQTNTVNISAEDFSPELVDYAISFIYSGVVHDIKAIDTNDSVADACVRLWVIADFLVLRELQKEAVSILQSHCDEKAKAMWCPAGNDGYKWFFAPHVHGYAAAVLKQLFRGVDTAFTQSPHSLPCQQVLVSFFHEVRAFVFGTPDFRNAMSEAPLQFSHELFMATIRGGTSKWTTGNSEYNNIGRTSTCTRCEESIGKQFWAIDPRMPSGPLQNGWGVAVRWLCMPCFQKERFEPVSPEEEKLRRLQNGPTA